MENTLKDKSYAFALRVVKLAQYLNGSQKEYVLSKQVLRSGTAIGALDEKKKLFADNEMLVEHISWALARNEK